MVLDLNTKNAEDPNSSQDVGSSGEICIIEADAGLGDLLVELLENHFLVKSFTGLKEFEKAFFAKENAVSPDLILCDSKLRDATGIEALRKVRGRDSIVPFILLVNQPNAEWTHEAFSAGVTDLLEKPFESLLFINTFRGRIAQARTSRERSRAQDLLAQQLFLTTTYANRLMDRVNEMAKISLKKLPYASKDEATIRFQHASKREEKLLAELEQCRNEYLNLAEKLGKS